MAACVRGVLYPVYTIKLARRASSTSCYILAGRASSMFARCLLDDCFMYAMLYAYFIFARCLLDRVNGVLGISADGTSHSDGAGVSVVAEVSARQLQRGKQSQRHRTTVPAHGRDVQQPRSLVRTSAIIIAKAASFLTESLPLASDSDYCHTFLRSVVCPRLSATFVHAA